MEDSEDVTMDMTDDEPRSAPPSNMGKAQQLLAGLQVGGAMVILVMESR